MIMFATMNIAYQQQKDVDDDVRGLSTFEKIQAFMYSNQVSKQLPNANPCRKRGSAGTSSSDSPVLAVPSAASAKLLSPYACHSAASLPDSEDQT